MRIDFPRSRQDSVQYLFARSRSIQLKRPGGLPQGYRNPLKAEAHGGQEGRLWQATSNPETAKGSATKSAIQAENTDKQRNRAVASLSRAKCAAADAQHAKDPASKDTTMQKYSNMDTCSHSSMGASGNDLSHVTASDRMSAKKAGCPKSQAVKSAALCDQNGTSLRGSPPSRGKT